MAREKKWSSQAEYKKWWREQNKERIKEYKSSYYQENKSQYRESQKQLKRTNRLRLIEMLGGECVDCGVTENLEFDHINPGDKVTNLCHLASSINKAKEEASKCELRCRDCHKERTRQQRELAWQLLSIIPQDLRHKLYLQPPQDLAELQHHLKSFDTTQQKLS